MKGMLLPCPEEEDGKVSSTPMTVQWKEWSAGFRKHNVLAPDAFMRDNLLLAIFKRRINKLLIASPGENEITHSCPQTHNEKRRLDNKEELERICKIKLSKFIWS